MRRKEARAGQTRAFRFGNVQKVLGRNSVTSSL